MTDTAAIPPLLALYYCAFLDGKIFEGWTHEERTIEHLFEVDSAQTVRRWVPRSVGTSTLSSLTCSMMPLVRRAIGLCDTPQASVTHSKFWPTGTWKEFVLWYHAPRYSWVKSDPLLRVRGGKTVFWNCMDGVLMKTKKGQNMLDKLADIWTHG